MLSNKAISNGKIVLVENEKFFINNDDAVKILNHLFTHVITFLRISQNDCKAFIEEITDPVLKAF